jgi:hypothetical protein
MMEPDYAKNIQFARDLVSKGQGEEMMPRHVFWASITAQRFLDLQDVGGRDDYFSSDYTNDQLIERLGHVGRQHAPSSSLRVLVAVSGSDEYVPNHIDTEALTQRMVDAMNHHGEKDNEKKVAQSLYIETANHNLSESPGDAQRFVENVAILLKQVRSER